MCMNEKTVNRKLENFFFNLLKPRHLRPLSASTI